MNYKKENKDAYDSYAKKFEDLTEDYLLKYILEDAKLFIANLPGEDILDLGSGPGRDSLYFKQNGLNPLCLDISSEMVNLCLQKGLRAEVGDLENLSFNDNYFDGVWAYTSLLHVPKNVFPVVLDKINLGD